MRDLLQTERCMWANRGSPHEKSITSVGKNIHYDMTVTLNRIKLSDSTIFTNKNNSVRGRMVGDGAE